MFDGVLKKQSATVETLKEARRLLGEGRHRWTKGALSRTASGDACMVNSPEAVSFCLSGAIQQVLQWLDLGIAAAEGELEDV